MTMPDQPKIGYRLIDADNHYYEPYDCFTRHLEPGFADRSVHVVKDERGLGRLYFGNRKLGFMRVIQSDYTGAPGSLHELFAGEMEQGFAQTEVINAHDFPAMMHKAPRLQLMDEQGLEATLMFPTVAVAVEHELHDDVDACYANLRAFNKWIEEDWGYGADGRVFGAPMLSLLSPEHAVAELDRVLAVGARMVHVKAGPAYGRSPADPAYDPFWARLDEAGLPVAIHSGDSGYNELWSVQWGEQPRPPLQFMTPFQWYLGYGDRPISDMLANLILNNLFGRFPRLRMLSIENGSAWVPGLLQSMDKAAKVGRRGTPVGGHVQDLPSEVFRRHVWVSPYFEEDPVPLSELIGVDRILFGSDWPHSEGIANPVDFAGKLTALGDDGTRRVMRSNVAELIGLPG
jgi:predicted TIM-barrel fold metal-dependent hydrolase